jgi:CheY-like chemotaxis protein
MAERTPREYLTKVLELSREMVSLASIDPGYELDVGCRTVFGTLFDYGYALKKMAEKELATHTTAGESSSRESPSPAGPSLPANPKTVLIADYDRDFLGHLSRLFQERGFETLTAFDSHEAVELSRARMPDLLVLESSMLGESGASVHQELEQDPELRGIPVILVTTSRDSPARAREPRPQVSEAVQFVAKPLETKRLWEAVRCAFGALPR